MRIKSSNHITVKTSDNILLNPNNNYIVILNYKQTNKVNKNIKNDKII